MNQPLAGRNAVITGASQGLGLAIAEAYVAAGASVLLCARHETQLGQARQSLADKADSSRVVEALRADVSNPADVSRLAMRAFDLFPQVHVLVNNAGIYGPIGPSEEVDWDEWVRAMEINVYGSVLPIRALLPHFKERGYGKIVQLSGGGATNPLPNISAYAASKAAIVRFAESLALELKPFHVDINTIAPGALNTRMLDQVLAAGPELAGREFYDRMARTKKQGGTPLEHGAALAVYLASSLSDGITGRLLSAVWDPWERLAARRDDLDASDVYTLRRIVPRDRGFTWGDR
jgi:NAD(P)-dependent dehydrogenase (short-subunit alcohol dehydrogenase family)